MLLSSKIGEGSFGKIYKGKLFDIPCIYKVEMPPHNHLKREHDVYKLLKDINGFPKTYLYIEKLDKNILIMEDLNNSLNNLFKQNSSHFAINFIYNIARQTIRLLNILYKHRIVHRDIKPGNLMYKDGMIYLIDFGLASVNNNYNTSKFMGTLRYASSNIHNGIEASYRDDLISLGYTLMYFANGGQLPWMNITITDNNKKRRIIGSIKNNNQYKENTRINEYMRYVTQLMLEDVPNYDYLITIFSDTL